MLVNHLSVKNKKICIEDQSISLRQYGVYLLQGNNGSGKTSLIKQLIFKENTIEFNNEGQEQAYKEEREKLISYLPQDIISYKSKVGDYIRKGRKDITDKEINNCLKQLNAANIELNMEFTFLSGGEKVKVALAALVLKDTPYIFMDEPTNNLDNETVKDLSEFINQYAKNHTIIIISHDNRLSLNTYKVIKIESNKIIQEEKIEEKRRNISEGVPLKINKFRMFARISWSKIRLLSILVATFVLIEAIFLNDINLKRKLSTSVPPEKNVILAYTVDQAYGELNKVYCDGKKLEIKEKNYYNMITYQDVPQIAQLDGVERIILYDDVYFDKMYNAVDNDSLLEEMQIVSQPEIIAENFSGQVAFGNKEELILEGKYPKDGKKEVAVSDKLLKKFFSFDDNMVEQAIGKEININEEKYTIVGITTADICLVSFNEDENYGFYQYNPNDYSNYVDKEKAYREKEKYYLENETELLFLFTSEGEEENILDQLMQKYPANNYNSSVYTKIWVKSFNTPIIYVCMGGNILLFLILSYLLLTINKGVLHTQMNKIRDYENYYLKNGMIRRFLGVSYLFEGIMMAGVVTIANILYSELSYLSWMILLVDIMILYIPLLVYIIRLSLKKVMIER